MSTKKDSVCAWERECEKREESEKCGDLPLIPWEFHVLSEPRSEKDQRTKARNWETIKDIVVEANKPLKLFTKVLGKVKKILKQKKRKNESGFQLFIYIW